MRELVRRDFRYFAWTTLAGVALRLIFIVFFSKVTVDSFIYGDIAKNWLQHGIYGVTDGGVIVPTYIRLPGYPMFLAGVFSVFGMEHYRAVLVLQLFIDLGTCFLIADMGRRMLSERTAKIAFLLAALCPFLANYTATALTETLEIFFTALALDLALAGLGGTKLKAWWGCGAAIGCAILLRPDGGLLLVAVAAYLFFAALHKFGKDRRSAIQLIKACMVVALMALAPLVPWTLRNWHTLHRFQPLAPRYANEENEFVPLGFNFWMRTWIADYASTEEVYWQVPGAQVDIDQLPLRAFDADTQREQTDALINDYNAVQHVTPELDARFAALAQERVHHSMLRYYVWLPALRIADMWLRPRTELLPSDTRWWEFDDDPKWSALAVGLGVINLLYVCAGLVGVVKARRAKHLWLLLLFVVLRSAFLGVLENPEPRYTLECFPVVIVLAAALFRSTKHLSSVSATY